MLSRTLTLACLVASLTALAACGSEEAGDRGDDAAERTGRQAKKSPERQAKEPPGGSDRTRGDTDRRRERPARPGTERRGAGGRGEPGRGEVARRLRRRQRALDEHQEQLPQERCHASYDPCLDPNASDYDCVGSGDGPRYAGPVTVKGDDTYDLDTDGDGRACES